MADVVEAGLTKEFIKALDLMPIPAGRVRARLGSMAALKAEL